MKFVVIFYFPAAQPSIASPGNIDHSRWRMAAHAARTMEKIAKARLRISGSLIGRLQQRPEHQQQHNRKHEEANDEQTEQTEVFDQPFHSRLPPRRTSASR